MAKNTTIAEDPTTSVDATITVDPENAMLKGVETSRAEGEKTINETYDGMGEEYNAGVDKAIQASKDGAQTLIDAQNAYTEGTVNMIEGQKEEAREDLYDEKRGAYADWKIASNPFGANAEYLAANGLSHSGFSETSQVRMYQAYQSRVASAFKAYEKAIANYNYQITQARNQNSVTIAEIASKALDEQMRITLEAVTYNQELLEKKTAALLENDRYHDTWYQDVYQFLFGVAQDERDFTAEQQWKAQEQANWEKEFEARYGDKEKEEIIINLGGTPGGNGNFKPFLTTGNKPLDRMTNVAGKMDKYPDFPTLPNGQAPHLTLEEVGIDNIHTVDDSNIKKELGDISYERLAALVGMGAIKEVLYEDKDGKIGLKFEIVNLEMAKKWMTGPTSSGRAATGMGAITRVNK